MKKYLNSLDEIAKVDRRKTTEVFVKEWGGWVRLQEMSADERDRWEGENFIFPGDDKPKFNFSHVKARLVVRCMVNEAGLRMGTDDEVAKVGSLGASSMHKLYTAAQKLNAITDADIEDLAGNSAAGPDAGSSSTSANVSA